MSILSTPELLAPAGTLQSLRYAFAYGADAVYAGQPRYSLRVRNNEFSLDNIKRGIEYAHERGKKFFLASNLLPHDNKIKTYIRDIAPIVEMSPDALIMSDPGLIMLVREQWPDLPIHLSVQANTLNSAAVKFWQSIGLSRIILSRELSLKEIESIRQACPDIELEVFVHGALCIAFSGRCLLSGYFNHRDANQGACTNACRWQYKTHESEKNITGDVVLIEEATRPGEMMPMEEDEHGTYIMNSKDLRAIEHVQRLMDIGIDSLKIEGRTKSYFYTARATQLYHQALNDAQEGMPFREDLLIALDGLSNRGYTEGFYRRHPPQKTQNYEEGASRPRRQQFVGDAVNYCDGMLEIEVKNKFSVGDVLTLIQPKGDVRFTLEMMENLDGEPVTVAPGSGYTVRIPISESVDPEFALLLVDITE